MDTPTPPTEASRNCPLCGARLPDGAGEDECPRCLMAQIVAPTQAQEGAAPEMAPPMAPEELAPHFPQFEILECLGRGGMGVVYKARQRSLDRLVAIKLLAPERAGDPSFAERFAREAKALAALSHPNIVGVHDFGEAGGFCYLVMEFVDGVNLRELLRSGKLSPEEALGIVPPVCDALQCAHDCGIVHRDIKPENLLLDKSGQVKIADFGIAKILGRDPGGSGGSVGEEAGPSPQQDSLPLGTPDYAAPEQAAGGADHRADIYSLGVVLYEMLTGERPGEIPQAPSKRVRVDIRIDEIVLRALEREPELRFATAAEFRSEVEAATRATGEAGESGTGSSAAPGSVAGPLGTKVRIAAGVTVGCLGVAVVVLVLRGLLGVFELLIFLALLGGGLWTAGFMSGESTPAKRRGFAVTAFSLFVSFAVLGAVGLVQAMSRPGGWPPGAVEAILLSLIWLGVFALPWAGTVLWRSSKPEGAGPTAPMSGCLMAFLAVVLVVAIVGMVSVLLYLLAGVSHRAEALGEAGRSSEHAISAAATAEGSLITELGEGVAVELLAVSRHPSEGEPWWRPDGSPAQVGPFESSGRFTYGGGEHKPREFVLRLHGVPEDFSIVERGFDPCLGSGGSGTPMKAGRYLADHRSFEAAFAPESKATTLRMALAYDPWQTLVDGIEPRGGVSFTIHRYGRPWSVSVAEAVEEDGDIRLSVLHAVQSAGRPGDSPSHWETRIVAVDLEGRERSGARTQGRSVGDARDEAVTFTSLTLAEVEEFRFQVRPYHWVEFSGISLDPVEAAPDEAMPPPQVGAPASPDVTAATRVLLERRARFDAAMRENEERLSDWTDSILEGDKAEAVRDLVEEARERVKGAREAVVDESLDGEERAVRDVEVEQALRDWDEAVVFHRWLVLNSVIDGSAEDFPGLYFHEVIHEGTEGAIPFKDEGGNEILIRAYPLLTPGDVDAAAAEVDDEGAIRLLFRPERRTKVRTATEAMLGRKVAVIVDSRLASAPVVRDDFDTEVRISHGFSREWAESAVERMKDQW